MSDLVVVELLDSSWLGLDSRGADRTVERELEIWALVPDAPRSQTNRSSDAWDDAVDAGPLVDVLRTRVLPESAQRAFASTARHLTAWWSSNHPSLTSEQAVARVRRVWSAANESPAIVDVPPMGPVTCAHDGWTTVVGSWTARCDADGLVTVLRPTGRAG